MNLEEELFMYRTQLKYIEEDEYHNKISSYFSNNKFEDTLNYDVWVNFKHFYKINKSPQCEKNDEFLENNNRNKIKLDLELEFNTFKKN
ncbi:hypothetical protein crov197 [Cafeteria roenbergensis virus]|uniref:Uncharacterized protein n=1 Tax=Cafeteria roenbergensis virus (strain BV-PW1) TaxID=693272 RepID=E3T4W7_CROVB|nr:hypothetical protein crov197 [Cafeteria roenbergensis virus BV-PW1]ADO67230.1 hypothetical protein crov197 [Cafeteria roenbergensis virus BV-PW1]